VVATIGCVGLLLTSCSGGDDDGGGGIVRESPCVLIARLDQIAATASSIDVSDPEASQAALDKAISDYVDTTRELRDVAPDELRADLEQVESAVQRGRFDDALLDRASVDAYAARQCGRTGTTTVAPSTTTSTVSR
jgi:hypothetical protein